MGNGMLSQEEIDALLSGSLEQESSQERTTATSGGAGQITDMEKDALGEIANISMGTAATTLSQLVGKRVEITTPQVDITTARALVEEYPVPHVLIDVKYKRGIEGSNMLVLSREDGAIIVDLMMGGAGQGTSSDLSEMQISGISEAMNQMMGSSATSMSTMFNSVVDITPPTVYVSELDEEIAFLEKQLDAEQPLVRISFRMIVEGIIDSILLQVIPVPVAKSMAAKLLGDMKAMTSATAQDPPQARPRPQPEMKPVERSQPQYAPPPPPSPGRHSSLDYTIPSATTGVAYQSKAQPSIPTMVQPAQFAPLTQGVAAALPNNLGLIYDVPLQVSVELGKATKTIKEILELGPGAVVELERLAGEPVDMIVNGKLIAKCEVVVINETFGIRITEIVNPHDRIDTLN